MVGFDYYLEWSWIDLVIFFNKGIGWVRNGQSTEIS